MKKWEDEEEEFLEAFWSFHLGFFLFFFLIYEFSSAWLLLGHRRKMCKGWRGKGEGGTKPIYKCTIQICRQKTISTFSQRGLFMNWGVTLAINW